jgi:hypothetical protein
MGQIWDRLRLFSSEKKSATATASAAVPTIDMQEPVKKGGGRPDAYVPHALPRLSIRFVQRRSFTYQSDESRKSGAIYLSPEGQLNLKSAFRLTDGIFESCINTGAESVTGL